MPLKLSLKPGEKFVLNGAVVQMGFVEDFGLVLFVRSVVYVGHDRLPVVRQENVPLGRAVPHKGAAPSGRKAIPEPVHKTWLTRAG